MKYRLLIALAGGLLTAAAVADTEVNKSLDAHASGDVEVQNVAGSIQVIGWSKNEVKVTGTLGDDVDELIFERDGDYIFIKVKVPRHHKRDISSDLVVHVPERSNIEISGVSADIEVEGVKGDQSLETVSGDVETESVEGDVEAGSVSGDVEIIGTGKEADTEAATVSGDVTLYALAGEVEAESVSGDVTVIDGSFDHAYFETVNGDIEFRSELKSGGELGIESINGTVEIEFRGGVSARFDVETFNGGIRNCFGPKPERTSRYSPGLELRFTHGDGDGRVVIETLNGTVHICDE